MIPASEMAGLIEKVVIPAAGLGTRLLSSTKEQPKEMLPVFSQDQHGALYLRPIVQLIFETLFDSGARKFCFIVGRGKRAIEDHFTPDHEFVQQLSSRGRDSQATELEAFYRRIEASTITWINQSRPKGFGDAVLQSESAVGNDTFLVHAGDTYIISKVENILKRLTKQHVRGSGMATLALQKVSDPRQYGVAEICEKKDGSLILKSVLEKPTKPVSNLAIMPLYIFHPVIFEALRDTRPGKGDEVQLTDGIQKLIEAGHKVQAIELRGDDLRLDIGTPENYWEALELSHRHALSKER
jgi:UTP--glucose-1-phosphate uridylyltransferase